MSIHVKVTYYEAAWKATGRRSEAITLPRGSTIRDAIHALAGEYGGSLSQLMFGEGSEPADYLTYFVDGVNIHSVKGFDTELKDGGSVVIAPTIVGG